MLKRKIVRRFFWSMAFLFVFINVLSAIHAYKFTHFTIEKVQKTKKPELLSFSEKLKTLFTGVNNPRPTDSVQPETPFEHVTIKSNKALDCWLMPALQDYGTVILFHGYGSTKSSQVNDAAWFVSAGYNALLVDFQGSGTSEGNETTIGFKEAEEVKSCYDYAHGQGDTAIFLYGGSMGAAAILKAMHDYQLKPKGIILECPFGSMYKTVCKRFHNMGIPTFPAAGLLTFWGGVENGFWAFSYKPSEYAKAVKCPSLLMYGAKDKNVGRDETDEIYANLGGNKSLEIFPDAGHESYFKKDKEHWEEYVAAFLARVNPVPPKDTGKDDTTETQIIPDVWGYRFTVTGNFDGKGGHDTLYEHYYSLARDTESKKFFDNLSDNDDWQEIVAEQEPISFLTCSNPEIDTLHISSGPYTFGIKWIKNDGDIMGNGKDVIEYVPSPAGNSNMRSCFLVTYMDKKWKILFHFRLNDLGLPDLPCYDEDNQHPVNKPRKTKNIKKDTTNIRAEKELKAFPGLVHKVKKGVFKFSAYNFQNASDDTIKIDILHHAPGGNVPGYDAGYGDYKN